MCCDFVCIGLDVREVAHDVQMQECLYVSSECKLWNSYDTWHGELFIWSSVTGWDRVRVRVVYTCIYFSSCPCFYMLGTKNVARALKSLIQGPQKQREMSWFQELVDKRMYFTLSDDSRVFEKM